MRVVPILMWLVAACATPGMARAQQPPALSATPALPPPLVTQSEADALAQDGAEYASQFGVSLDEAIRRLRAQAETVPATGGIAERFRDRLAGIAIEHRPAYRIVVALTGDAPVPSKSIAAGGMRVPIVFRTRAKATRDQVIWAMTNHQAEIRAALPSPPSMGLDPRTGELVIAVGSAGADDAEALRTRLEGIAKVPVQLRFLDHREVNLAPEGGARVEGLNPADGKRYYCTTAFSVTDGMRYGLTTAAHCPDALTYRDPGSAPVPLDFLGQWGWGYQDVQINLAPMPLRPRFFVDAARTTERPVTGQRGRTSTRSGDFVCHRGERTGYSCALVELTDFAPAGDLCGGACLANWVTVAGPTCKGGDSGAPVFSGTTAFGILKGGSYRGDGSCVFYFYMSVDYLPTGWTLLTEGGPVPQVATPVGPPAGANP